MKILLLLILHIPRSFSFIVGGCVGPKSVLERHLNDKQKSELRNLVHTKFDGSNSDQILEEVNRFVFGHITEQQWHSIVPEIAEYQAKKHECSLYAQLLPKPLFKQLLKSVHRASEMGASKYDVKRLVDDYVERLAKAGVLPDRIDSATAPRGPTLPENRIESQSYHRHRNIETKWSKKTGGGKKGAIHPTLIAFPEVKQRPHQPMFPIARPSPYDLGIDYDGGGGGGDDTNNIRTSHQRLRNNHHRHQQQQKYGYSTNKNNIPFDRCDYYAGPCATSF